MLRWPSTGPAETTTTARLSTDKAVWAIAVDTDYIIDVLLWYLFGEEEECCLVLQAELERSSPKELFTSRKEQACQRILIERHLLKDEYIFIKFLRINKAQINCILSLIETEIFEDKSYRPACWTARAGVLLDRLESGGGKPGRQTGRRRELERGT